MLYVFHYLRYKEDDNQTLRPSGPLFIHCQSRLHEVRTRVLSIIHVEEDTDKIADPATTPVAGEAAPPKAAPKNPKKKATLGDAKNKKPADHPKYSEMIQKALNRLKERGGSPGDPQVHRQELQGRQRQTCRQPAPQDGSSCRNQEREPQRDLPNANVNNARHWSISIRLGQLERTGLPRSLYFFTIIVYFKDIDCKYEYFYLVSK